jgi:hypothetical protein
MARLGGFVDACLNYSSSSDLLLSFHDFSDLAFSSIGHMRLSSRWGRDRMMSRGRKIVALIVLCELTSHKPLSKSLHSLQ